MLSRGKRGHNARFAESLANREDHREELIPQGAGKMFRDLRDIGYGH